MRTLTWWLAGLGLLAALSANAWYTPLPNARNTSCFTFPTWTARDSARVWRTISMSADGVNMLAAVSGGYLYISNNSGVTWTAKTGPGSHSWTATTTSRNFDTLAAGDTGGTGKISVSTDDGTTWTAYDSARNWFKIASTQDANIMYAVLDYNTTALVYKSTDMGLTWATLANSGSRKWNDIATTPDGKTVIAGGSNVIATSTNAGSTWTVQTATGCCSAVGISDDGTIMVAAKYGSQLMISKNGGSTWTSPAMTGKWSAVAVSADGTKMAAAPYDNYIYLSNDSGTTWTTTGTVNAGWWGLAMSPDGSKLAATVDSGQIYTASCSSINR